MLEFHPLKQEQASPVRLVTLLKLAKTVLQERGMASMDEYGDMLKWGLPMEDGVWRNLHVFHPDWCSFDDRFRGTIHFHAGEIRGTILAGHMEHYTYEATPAPDGDRFYRSQAYRLTKHAHQQPEGTEYVLPGKVPHWVKPTALSITYFEEVPADAASDLVEPATDELDDHRWTQEMADALLPELLAMIDARLAKLAVPA